MDFDRSAVFFLTAASVLEREMCYDSGRLSFWQVRLQVWISPWVVGGMNTRIENNKKSSIQILSNLCIVSAYYLFIVSAYVCLHCLYIIHVCIIGYAWIQKTAALLSIHKYVCSLGIYMSWPWRYRKSHVRTNSLNDETNYKMNLKQAEHSKWKSLSDYTIFSLRREIAAVMKSQVCETTPK